MSKWRGLRGLGVRLRVRRAAVGRVRLGAACARARVQEEVVGRRRRRHRCEPVGETSGSTDSRDLLLAF